MSNESNMKAETKQYSTHHLYFAAAVAVQHLDRLLHLILLECVSKILGQLPELLAANMAAVVRIVLGERSADVGVCEAYGRRHDAGPGVPSKTDLDGLVGALYRYPFYLRISAKQSIQNCS